MITRMVKQQLLAFWTAALLGIVVLALVFLRVPEALSIGRYTVQAEFGQGSGIYDGAQVNYLGHPVGRVTGLSLAPQGLVADLKLSDDVAIPKGSSAEIHSMSAVGEQFIELVPPSDGADAESLADGDRIPLDRTSYPVEIGPVLDNVYNLVETLPSHDLDILVDEASRALDGRAVDLQSILDGSGRFLSEAQANLDPTRALISDTAPVLATLNARSSNVVSLTSQLAQVTDELRAGDADLRTLLAEGPAFSAEATKLIDELEPRLPALLDPLGSVARMLAPYSGHLAQILSDYPVALSIVQSVNAEFADDHQIALTVANISSPGECRKGFLPVSQWRSPQDTGLVDPQLVWCAAPAGDPRVYKGARNIPCAENPARRAATVTLCRR